jgi:hypothetical protein
MTKIRSIDLTDLMSQFRDFTQVLGPEEIKILTDADLLLKVTIPQDDTGRLAYLSRSAQIQNSLNNLLSRLSYIWKMHTIDRDAHLGQLIESEEVEGRDRRYFALTRNPKFRDQEETSAALEVIKDHVNNLLWILKTVMGRL